MLIDQFSILMELILSVIENGKIVIENQPILIKMGLILIKNCRILIINHNCPLIDIQFHHQNPNRSLIEP